MGSVIATFGYRIENGYAVVDEASAGQIQQIFQFYLEGDSLTTAAKKAGIIFFMEESAGCLKICIILEMNIILQS